MRNSNILLPVILLISRVSGLIAGTEPVNHRLASGTLVNGAVAYVADNKWPVVNQANSYTVTSAYVKIVFGIDERVLDLSGAHTTAADVDIVWRDAQGAAATIKHVTLTASYDPGKSLNTFTYQNTYAIKGAHQAIVIVNKLYDVANPSVPLANAAVPKHLYLEAEQASERYYAFNPNYIAHNNSTYGVAHNYLSGSNELEISWKQIPGAEEYDLEWTYVNDYTATQGIYGSNAIDLAFANNATRIRTGNQNYRVSLNYEHGYLFYRVRGIGRLLLPGTPNTAVGAVEGDWSVTDLVSSGYTRPLSTWLSASFGASIGFYYAIQAHDDAKNLQYAATFAEEGKKKEVMSYFDGSLRNRQTVTKANTTRQVIVGETFYDHQGRPAVTALPAPAYNAGTGLPEQALRYYEDFNLSETRTYTATSTPAQFSRADFDEQTGGGSCPLPSNGMHISSGASNYFSGSNPDKEGSQAYVPDADKYPFTHTIYTPDNTGRVRQQSGAGKDLRIGAGHETSNLYDVPTQDELDRLFGAEAGSNARYKKNTVVDPNGQISISYLNSSGKTVATALAGNTPGSLNPLGASGFTNVAKLLNYDDWNYTSVNNFNGSALVFSRPIVPSVSGAHAFTYDLTVPQFTDNCLSICYSCDYILEISIKDECGTLLYPTLPTTIAVNGVMDTTCSGPVSFHSSTGLTSPAFTVNLSAAKQYYLEKKLTINPAGMQAYLEHYISTPNNSCIKDKSYFVNQALADIDLGDCNISCASCATMVTAFIGQHNNAALANDPDYLYLSPEEQQALYDKCNEACKPVSKCETQFKLMLGDVSPGGQYGQFDKTGNYDASGFPLSVYNLASDLPKGTANLNAAVVMFNSVIVTIFQTYVPGIGNQFINCFQGLTSNEWSGWRYPKFYNVSARTFQTVNPPAPFNSVYHYYDDATGTELSKIYVAKTPSGVYNPAVSISAVIKTDPVKGTYVYPEELLELKDFINNFKPTWAYSLVKNHPEWCYFTWCDEQTVRANPLADHSSSEGFDNYLRAIDTWTDAIDPTNTGITGFDPNTSTITDFISADPYFNGTGQGLSNISGNVPPGYLQSLMIHKLTNFLVDPANNTNVKNAKEAANYICRYATLYGDNGPFSFSFGQSHASTGLPFSITTADETKLLNKEWTAYRDFYLATKSEVQAIGSHIHAINKNDSYHCGCYNGCIGNSTFDGYTLPGNGEYDGFATLAPFSYSGGSSTYYGLITMGGYVQNSQPCNADKKLLYSGKDRRFIYSSDMLSAMGVSGTDPATIGSELLASGEYQTYLATGQCPAALKLQNFLNDMAGANLFSTSLTHHLNLYLHPSFDQTLYSFVNGGVSLPFNLYYAHNSNSAGVFTLDFQDGSSSSVCTLTLTGTSLWDQIVMFNGIKYTSANNFDVYAFIDDDNDPSTGAVQVLLQGGSSCINSSCQFPDVVCQPNQSAKDLLGLTNNIFSTFLAHINFASFNNLFGTNYDLAAASSPESVFLTPALKSSLGITAPGAPIIIPYYVFSNNSWEYRLSDPTNPPAITGVSISAVSPPAGFPFVSYFGNLVPDENNPCLFTLRAYYTTTVTDNSVSPPLTITTTSYFIANGRLLNNCFPLGDCASPIPQSCNTPAYKTLLDLGKFLNEVKDKNPSGISLPLDLSSYNYFTNYLKAPVNAGASGYLHSYNVNPDAEELIFGNEPNPGVNDCSIRLALPSGVSWSDISRFSKFAADATNYGAFSCSIDYLSGGSPATAIITGTSCYSLGNCDDCTQNPRTVIFQEDFDRFNTANPPHAGATPDYSVSTNPAGQFIVTEDHYSKSPAMLGGANTLGQMSASGYPDAVHSTITNIKYVGIGITTTATPAQHTPSDVSTASPPDNAPPEQDMMQVFLDYNYSKFLGTVIDYYTVVYDKDIPLPAGSQGKSYELGIWYNDDFPANELVLELYGNNTLLKSVLLTGNPHKLWRQLKGTFYANTGSVMNFQVRLRYIGLSGNAGTILFDDVSLAEFGCEKTVTGPPVTATVTNECEDQLSDLATYNGQTRYRQFTDSVSAAFKTNYVKACRKTLETITDTYQDKTHHFTLYYYDQAGNLIKTVPPEGVEPADLSVSQAAIDSDKRTNTQNFFMGHRMATSYEYNSLNQLVKQKMPDHETVDLFDAAALAPLASGLPAGVNVKDLDFYQDGNHGILAGDNTSGAGVIYTSGDGGATWSLAGLGGAGEMNAVEKVGVANVFAVSSTGNLLRSTDNGVTWSVYSLTSGSALNALAFFEDPAVSGQFIGLAGGDNSQVYFCKFPVSGPPQLKAVTLPGGLSGDIRVVRQLYYSGPGPALRVFVLGGSNGLLLHSYNPAQILANTSYYADPPTLSVLGSPFHSRLSFNDLDLEMDGTPLLKGFAAGKDPGNANAGFASYLELGLSSPSANLLRSIVFTTAPKEIRSITRRAAGAAGMLDDDINLGGLGGEIYHTSYSGNLLMAITHTEVPSGVDIHHIEHANKSAALPGNVYAFGSDGSVYVASSPSGSFLFLETAGASVNGAYIPQPYAGTNPIFIAAAGGAIYKATPNAGLHDIANSIAISSQPFNAVSIAGDNSGAAFVAGDNGNLYKSDRINGGWTLVSASGNFKSVCALSATDVVVTASNGNAYRYNGTGLSPAFISASFSLNKVYFKNQNEGYLLGNNGVLYRTSTGSSGFSAHSQSPFTGTNFNDMSMIASTGFIVGSTTTGRKTTDNGVTWSAISLPFSPVNRVLMTDLNTVFVFGNSGNIAKSTDGGNSWTSVPVSAASSNFYAVSGKGNISQMLAAGSGATGNAFLLNSQQGAAPTVFYYDQLGRLIISQNGRQFNKLPKAYSYTTYDALGRITQVGEIASSVDPKTLANYNSVIGFNNYTSWLSSGTKTEVTTTLYDNAAGLSHFRQENLRKRVSATFIDTDGSLGNGFTHATYYSYDVHGNVKSLLQGDQDLVAADSTEGYRRIDYTYDLVSGKVNEIIYQPGKPDELRQRYEYDADNRVTNVLTSRDGGLNWRQDAKYFYYKHGPLARTEIGPNKTQGIDYAYTLQGWIKGVNSGILKGATDIGKDALSGSNYISTENNLHKLISNDVYAYSLNYYGTSTTADYKAIDATKYSYSGGSSFDADPGALSIMAPGANNGLYNGNISAMQTTLVKVNVGSANASLYTAQPQLAGYKYDQLNRINEMRTYADLAGGSVISNNNYASLSGSADAYRNTFSYDANGNIESQKRYSDNGTLLDDLTYRYELDGTGKKRSNKLYHVNDSGTSASGDINDQGTFSSASINNLNNYSYDEIGNLVKDKAEEIDKITWTVYGKIKTIERLNTSSKPDLEFVYDAQGNRIQKIVKPKSAPGVLVATNNFINTYYTKDAQGNTLATYEKTGGSLKLKDHSIYGSARLGVLNTDKPYSALSPVYNATNTTGTTYKMENEGGAMGYEFSNHLGNVLTVVSDRKLPVDNNSDGTIDGFVSDVLSTSDYYAFGAPMPGRQYNSGDYRYGFNGKENDNEVKGTGNQQDYGMRIYDPRLGKFLSVDPLTQSYPMLTPYQFASNNPIQNIDLDGMEGVPYTDPMTPVWEGFGELIGAAASWIDSWIVGNKEEIKVTYSKDQIDASTSVTRSTYIISTNEINTNFKGNFDYIKYHNSNKGNTEPLIKIKNETETGSETQLQTKVNGGVTVTNTQRTNTEGVMSNELKMEKNTTVRKLPISIDGSTKTSDEKTSIKVGVGTQKLGEADHNTQFKIYGESSTKKDGSSSVNIGVSNTTTEGNTSIKSDIYIKKD